MKLASAAHTSQPWRIHALTQDFRLEDVWALPTPGARDDFPQLVQLIASFDSSRSSSQAVRALFAVREKVGDLFGWEDPSAGQGREGTIRDRLPADLREGSSAPDFEAFPFTSLYLTDDEWAVEAINRTVHGVLHFGWVREESGEYRGQMAIYVKRNGLFGAVYMAAIAPFRHQIVYPRTMRELGREWRARRRAAAPGAHQGTDRSAVGDELS